MLFFAFYCVLIPTTVIRTGLIGAATLAITSLPEALVTGEIWRLGAAAIGSATGFAILLCGRQIANASWEREFTEARLRSDFASTVSHEFRSPLTSLCLLTEQLAEGRIVEESDRATCYRMLMAEKFEILDLPGFVTFVAREFERNDLSRGCRVEVRVEGNMPLVKGDRAALRSVLWNLPDNAVKYSPDGDTVRADVRAENAHAAIRIRDRGLGIPDGEQPHIFEKFVRGEAAKKNAIRGTGLGLAIAHPRVHPN